MSTRNPHGTSERAAVRKTDAGQSVLDALLERSSRFASPEPGEVKPRTHGVPCDPRSMRHRQGDRLVLAAIANPQRIASRLDCRRLREAIENSDDGSLIAVDRNL